MPIITRFITGNRFRKVFRCRQGQVVVSRAARDGSHLTSVLVSNGTQQSAGFTDSKCINKRCRS